MLKPAPYNTRIEVARLSRGNPCITNLAFAFKRDGVSVPYVLH
jgi:hypothetical protein